MAAFGNMPRSLERLQVGRLADVAAIDGVLSAANSFPPSAPLSRRTTAGDRSPSAATGGTRHMIVRSYTPSAAAESTLDLEGPVMNLAQTSALHSAYDEVCIADWPTMLRYAGFRREYRHLAA